MLGVFSMIKFYARNTRVEQTTHECTGEGSEDPTDVTPSSLCSSWGASPSPFEVVPPVGNEDAGTESGDNDATEPRLDSRPLTPESATLSPSSIVLHRANTWFTICVRPP
jgi:hypothetical protein